MSNDVVVLNSTVLPYPSSGRPYRVVVSTATLAEVRWAVVNGAMSFIGHEGTALSLGLPYNRGMVKSFKRAYVVRLKKRLAEGEVLPSVTEAEVEVLRLDIDEWVPSPYWQEGAKGGEGDYIG